MQDRRHRSMQEKRHARECIAKIKSLQEKKNARDKACKREREQAKISYAREN